MDPRTVDCPSCGEPVAYPAPQGGLRVHGLATTLIAEDGTIHGPCRKCRKPVILAQKASVEPQFRAVLDETRPSKRRPVLVLVRDDTG